MGTVRKLMEGVEKRKGGLRGWWAEMLRKERGVRGRERKRMGGDWDYLILSFTLLIKLNFYTLYYIFKFTLILT